MSNNVKYLKRFSAFGESIKAATPDQKAKETHAEKEVRKKRLLNNFEEFCYYYFPKVAKAKFAKWHRKYTRHMIENDRSIAAIMVARDQAKSSVTDMLDVFLYLKGEIRSMALFSHTETQAKLLLKSIKTALEKNQRIINDFGIQKGARWQDEWFITKNGASFRAFGAGQNPRGGKDDEEATRFDRLRFDDFDDPEVCRNPTRLDQHWKYVQGDCFGALHISGKYRITFLNNKIDEDCIIQRAYDLVKDKPGGLRLKVNLLDKDGNPTWPEAYTKEQCQEMINLMEDEADTEYFNNPSIKGKEFQKLWFIFAKLPPLRTYRYLISYLDGGFKKSEYSDTKCLVLIGLMNGEYHIRKVYLTNASKNEQVAWHYDLDEFLKKNNATAQMWMEEVFLLDMLYENFADAASPENYGYQIPIKGDKRQKPDKDLRIAATAGNYERKKVIFDESLKDDPDTKRLISQYLRFRVGSKTKKDGPDAVEGAMFKLKEMVFTSQPPETGTRTRSNKMY
ncbi:hypothetical protein C900_05368 [Fulvivirga imtechensis AK7]|uniref:Uncharacterized protein n=1 Tax=Fulvivirga imtechensis AK7 TaxID=1237149 RepID=L8JP60_9BACT|nr:hypothetical protein [Fulvivirga imtechensis]ELR69172.1 hypothetical protein C900_05368 [Fulvivirga imtechensis AK7]